MAVAVAWMLAALATLAAEIVGLASWLLMRDWQAPEGRPNTADVLPGMMLFSGLVTGLVALALTYVVYRLQTIRPPRAVTIFVVIVSLAPPITIAIRALAG